MSELVIDCAAHTPLPFIIQFPERKSWRRQVQTKDQTSSKKPILLKGFVQHVGRSIEAYFEKVSIHLDPC